MNYKRIIALVFSLIFLCCCSCSAWLFFQTPIPEQLTWDWVKKDTELAEIISGYEGGPYPVADLNSKPEVPSTTYYYTGEVIKVIIEGQIVECREVLLSTTDKDNKSKFVDLSCMEEKANGKK